jgi:putative hydrolase of the HAD superfamily
MDLHEDVEFHIATILKRIGQPVNAHTMEMVRCRFREAQEATFRLAAPYKDAIPFLERAQQAGFVLHLATGDHAPQKAQGVEKWGGRRYFTELFDNEIVGVNKGNAEYYRRALRTLGCSRDQALVIGDSPFNDIGPALELGLTAIWLNRDGKRFPLNGVRPDLEVATLLDVLTVL